MAKTGQRDVTEGYCSLVAGVAIRESQRRGLAPVLGQDLTLILRGGKELFAYSKLERVVEVGRASQAKLASLVRAGRGRASSSFAACGSTSCSEGRS